MQFFNPINIVRHLWQHRNLIRQLTRREVLYRYKGSYLGLFWAFLQPLLMLAVYTFVFSVVFENKWGISTQNGRLTFAMALFCGILTFNILGDVAGAAPGLIISNSNFVKKVIFPLEILPVVKLLGTLIHACFGLVILFVGMLIAQQPVSWTVLLLPLTWLPVTILSMGCGFFLASLGVFIRDIGTTVGVVVSVFFFMSPIFYPMEAVPEEFRFFARINPIAIYVEDARRVLLWGQCPDWPWFFPGLLFAIIVFIFGFIFFMRSKKAFADVI
jgi:lipopolysaccharide transport system permease protein